MATIDITSPIYGAASTASDNTSAINAAIAALSNGDTLKIPAGNYRTTGHVIYNKQYVTVRSEGATLTNISNNPLQSVLELQSSCYCTVEKLQVTSATPGLGHGIVFRRPTNSIGQTCIHNKAENCEATYLAVGFELGRANEGQTSELTVARSRALYCGVGFQQDGPATEDIIFSENCYASCCDICFNLLSISALLQQPVTGGDNTTHNSVHFNFGAKFRNATIYNPHCELKSISGLWLQSPLGAACEIGIYGGGMSNFLVPANGLVANCMAHGWMVLDGIIFYSPVPVTFQYAKTLLLDQRASWSRSGITMVGV